jgi:RimJ/RimL family protein N-acetyltransferase
MKRLLNEEPPVVFSRKAIQAFIEGAPEEGPWNDFVFHIHSLAGDQLIGHISIREVSWTHGDAWIGMVIGDRENWNRGYGTDALRLALRYAFDELNLHRVTLGVYAYNRRAIHIYEKLGFRIEGVERAAVHREGRRHDAWVMGMLREEWAAMDATEKEG